MTVSPGCSTCSVKQKHSIFTKCEPAEKGVTLKLAVPATGRALIADV